MVVAGEAAALQIAGQRLPGVARRFAQVDSSTVG